MVIIGRSAAATTDIHCMSIPAAAVQPVSTDDEIAFDERKWKNNRIYLRGKQLLLEQFHRNVIPDLLRELEKPNQRWRQRAGCAGLDTSLFFPDNSGQYAQVISAFAGPQTCQICPVRISCLAEGLREHYGIWGGLSIRQRRTVKRTLSLVAGKDIVPPPSTAVHFYLDA